MMDYVEVDHPLIKHKLAVLRDKKTEPSHFREFIEEISLLLAVEATKDMDLKEVDVETPLEETSGYKINDDVVLVPILRAGAGMINPLLKIIPDSCVYHLGLYRNENTLEAVEYYVNLPEDLSHSIVFILDPMFATGNTLKHSLDIIIKRKPKKVKFLSIISAPEAIENLKDYPYDFMMYTASVDRELNDKSYILPGLGDAGDRIYGTL
jgi:uracil phosphoribosyltransferase